MSRVILDTNVLLSGILKASSIPAAAVRFVSSKHVMLTSNETQGELRRVLFKPYFQRVVTDSIMHNIDEMFAASELVVISQTVTACRDAADDKFLELALNGNADFIISGDKDLLSMKAFKETRILTPAGFLNIQQ